MATKNNFLIYLIFIVVLQSCVIAETVNQPETLFLQIDSDAIEKISVYFRHPHRMVNCQRDSNSFTVNIPRMEGGFSQLFGQKFNEHNPYDYRNILIYEGELEIKKLSVNDTYGLDKIEIDSFTIYRLTLD